MDIFHKLKGFDIINENVAVEEDVALLVTGTDDASPHSYLTMGNAIDIAETLNATGDPNLAATIRNFPKVNGIDSPRYGLVIYTSKRPKELEAAISSIPALSQYHLSARRLIKKPGMWTPYDTARAKETAKRTNSENDLNAIRQNIDEIIKSNKNDIAEKTQNTKDEFDSLNETSTIKEQIRVRDNAINSLKSIKLASTALEGLPGVEKGDIVEIKQRDQQMKDIINSINKSFEKKKNTIVSTLNDLNNSNKSKEEANQIMGDVGTDILQLNKGDIFNEKVRSQIKELYEKARNKYNVNTKEVTENVIDSRFINIARKYKLFEAKKYKSEHQLMLDYFKIQDYLDALKDTNKEEYQKYFRGLENLYLYKLGKLRNESGKKDINNPKNKSKKENIDINKYEELNKTLVTNKDKVNDTITMDYGEGKTFTEYPIDVHLPLGKTIVVNNLQQIEDDDIKKNRSENAGRFLHILKRGIDSVIGYEPQGGAEAALQSMKGANRLFGELFGWAIGTLSGTAIGATSGVGTAIKGEGFKKGYRSGKETGGKFGDAFKFGIINNPDEINPAVADFGHWINKQLDLRTSYYDKSPYFNSTRGTYLPSPKRIKESAGAVAMDSGASANTTPGINMNVPGSVPGINNPIPPTPEQTPYKNGVKTLKSDSGSGDNFQPTIKEKKKKKKNYK